MPFEDDYADVEQIKSTVKQVGPTPSIASKPKPSQEESAKAANQLSEKSLSYKKEIAGLTAEFMKIMADKTLKENKNPFSQEYEKEILSKIIQFASKINKDQLEEEGIGSLSLIALLLKVVISFRDRSNGLEYQIRELQKISKGT